MLFVFANNLSAAEIIVTPGSGTLATAIGNASNGDILILQDGGYYGSVTINRSLTIRPVNKATNALIGNAVTISGFAINVTLQGLKISAPVYLTQAASIHLLENEWLDGGLYGTNYRSSDGDGTLVIVGNKFASGANILDIRIDGAYIAGNKLFGGFIDSESYVWIVGNEIVAANTAILSKGTGNILANRVRCNAASTIECIEINGLSTLVAGNLIEVNDTADGITYIQNAIQAVGTGETVVLNNVIRSISQIMDRTGSAISITTPSARVSGNIIVNYASGSFQPIFVTSTLAEVTHNLCWNNSGSCPAGDGNLNVDPEFTDLVDYELSLTSPAIDAGPADFNLADLDRTRNDMGIHGGPWSIDQYDSQRDPNSFAPYSYPLLNVNSMLSGGLLEYTALGVARLR